MLFRGRPVMVHDMHTRRRRLQDLAYMRSCFVCRTVVFSSLWLVVCQFHIIALPLTLPLQKEVGPPLVPVWHHTTAVTNAIVDDCYQQVPMVAFGYKQVTTPLVCQWPCSVDTSCGLTPTQTGGHIYI